MGPIALSFDKKCYNVTAPGDNLDKTCFHWMHVLTAQAQVTASGMFPWSDWSTRSADRYSCQRNSFSAECTCRLHAVVSMTLCAFWRKQTSARSSRPIKIGQHTRMTTGSRKPGAFIKTAHHGNNNDNTNNDNNNNYKIIIVTIIIITIMALSFNHGYHWRIGCTELNYVYPLWVNIYLEKRSKTHRHILFILQNIDHRDLIAI